MKLKLKDIDKKWMEYALAGCVCILFFLCIANLGKVWSVLVALIRVLKPVIIGFIIAYIINPVANFADKKVFKKIKRDKLRWILSVVISLILVLFLIFLLMASLIPEIIGNIVSLAMDYQDYIARLQAFMDTSDNPLFQIESINAFLDSLSKDGGLINRIGNLITNNANQILAATSSIGSAAINWLIGGIFAVYFLMAKSSIAAEFSKILSLILSPLRFERLLILMSKFNSIFTRYIVFELLDSLIVAVSNYIFMAFFHMPDALFVSMVVGVTNLAPTFGPIVGAVIGGFILLLLKPSTVIPFIIFTFILQTIDGYVLKPKLFGGALNVPGVLILTAIIVFGKLMGVLGMLIAIPAAAILVYVYTEALVPWLELRRDLRKYEKEAGKK